MTIQALATLLSARVLCEGDGRPVTCGCVCDLLSWVMARGQSGAAWVTVQTHMNVVAVASLHDMACVVLPENMVMEGEPLRKAREEGIAVLSSPLSGYAVCARMAASGISAADS